MRVRTGVRRRVTLVAAVVLAVVLTLVGVGLVMALRAGLVEAVDAALVSRLGELEVLFADGDGSGADTSGDDLVWLVVGTTDGQVVTATDQRVVLGASDALADVGPLAPVVGVHELRGEDGPVPDIGSSVTAPTTLVAGPLVEALGADVRVITSDPDKPRVVWVVANLDDVEDAVRLLELALVVAVPLATGILAWLVWALVGRALAPVEAIRAEVAAISGSDLGRRVPAPAGDDEIARLAATMNAMLDRLEASARSQRRFVGDASHELRTPLARLRVQLETAQPDDDLDVLRRALLADAGELERLVDDLLLLARLDELRAPLADGPVDLDEVVLEEVARARAVGSPVVADDVAPVSTRGDARALGRVVRNLLDNAARHAASRIVVTVVAVDGGHVRVTVADDGPGVEEEVRRWIFERFTRTDDARVRGGGGAGLGLAIVREVVQRHGGQVEVVDAAGGGAAFVVTLPSWGDTEPPV